MSWKPEDYTPDYTPEEEAQLETDLRQWIADYLDGNVALHDFRVWLLSRSWKLHLDIACAGLLTTGTN